MSAYLLQVATRCRKCQKPLTLAEMHYYADEDGTATCNDCEAEWSRAMVDYMRGLGPLPEQP